MRTDTARGQTHPTPAQRARAMLTMCITLTTTTPELAGGDARTGDMSAHTCAGRRGIGIVTDPHTNTVRACGTARERGQTSNEWAPAPRSRRHLQLSRRTKPAPAALGSAAPAAQPLLVPPPPPPHVLSSRCACWYAAVGTKTMRGPAIDTGGGSSSHQHELCCVKCTVDPQRGTIGQGQWAGASQLVCAAYGCNQSTTAFPPGQSSSSSA